MGKAKKRRRNRKKSVRAKNRLADRRTAPIGLATLVGGLDAATAAVVLWNWRQTGHVHLPVLWLLFLAMVTCWSIGEFVFWLRR
jgi:hypothetical protein